MDELIILELVSKELNHFGVIADLFRQIGGHSIRFVHKIQTPGINMQNGRQVI